LYWSYADAATGVINNGTYNYCYNALDAMYGGWDGFVIVSDTKYDGSKLTVTDDQIVLKLKGIAEYVFNKNAAPVEPEEPEVFDPFATAALVTDTTFNGFNPYDVTFGFENGDQVVVRFNTGGAQYLHLGAWQTDNWQDPHYISQVKYNGELASITACNVAYENDAYTVTMSVFEYTNYNTFEYTYTGAIEGLIAPEACDCLKEPEAVTYPSTENLTLKISTKEGFGCMSMGSYAQLRFVDSEDKNFVFFEINDGELYNHTYVHDGNVDGDSYDPGTLYQTSMYMLYEGAYYNDNTYTSHKITGGTVDVKVDGDNCTITIDFTLSNGQKYSGVYSGAKPF
jgi:hypothetical protein